jgi:hypothetical protein
MATAGDQSIIQQLPRRTVQLDMLWSLVMAEALAFCCS